MLDFVKAQEMVAAELDNYRFESSPAELYEPVSYILALGGKRMRPALTLMACSMFSDAIHKAIKPALAFEVFHNFTLLHDDLMDNSALRRGKETVHVRWNANAAILSGDVMSILSYKLLSESEEGHLKDLLQLFNTTALEVCEGQQYDMNFESRKDVTVSEYLRMIELKTAVLIAASLKAGAICGGTDLLQADLVYEFGRNLGIAFQIRDDYLDVYGDQEVFGKKIGNDILTNKKTFLLIKALELSDGKSRRELDKWLNAKSFDPEDKIESVTGIFNDLGIDEITMDLAEDRFEMALQYLDRVEAAEERKSPLEEFASEMINRNK
jgi:geranylgeranyl diphosphate synthase type II